MSRAALVCVLLLLCAAGPGTAEVFRCEEPGVAPRYVDDPGACGGAPAEPVRGRIERVPSPEPQSAGAASPAAIRPGAPPPRLEEVLSSQSQVSSGWDVVEETPVDARRDPDLVRWGVRDKRARHYTRRSRGSIQVCSVEVWAFASEPNARAAHGSFEHPGWEIEREGSLLVMVRGLTRASGSRPRRGVFPDCHQLGEQVRERAARIAAPPLR